MVRIWRNKYLLKVSYKSSKSAGFPFAFHEFEDISNSNGAFDVADEVTLIGLFSGNENDFDLRDAASRAGPSQQLRDSGFHGLRFHLCRNYNNKIMIRDIFVFRSNKIMRHNAYAAKPERFNPEFIGIAHDYSQHKQRRKISESTRF